MSYHVIGQHRSTSGWYEDYVKGWWWGDAAEGETGACTPGLSFDKRFCDLERKQAAESAAAKEAGITLTEWLKRQEKSPPNGALGDNKVVILGGAALVAYLLFRKK